MLNPDFSVFFVYFFVAFVFTAVLVQRLCCCFSKNQKQTSESETPRNLLWHALIAWSRVGCLVLSYGTMSDNLRQFLASFYFWPKEIVEAANETIATAMYAELSSECPPETCGFLRFQTYMSWQGTVLHTLLGCLSVMCPIQLFFAACFYDPRLKHRVDDNSHGCGCQRQIYRKVRKCVSWRSGLCCIVVVCAVIILALGGVQALDLAKGPFSGPPMVEKFNEVPLVTVKRGATGLLAVFAFAFLMLFSAIMICVVQIDGAVGAWIMLIMVQLVCIGGQGALASTTGWRYYVSNFLEQLQIGSVVVADGVLNPIGPLEEKLREHCGCFGKHKSEKTADPLLNTGEQSNLIKN